MDALAIYSGWTNKWLQSHTNNNKTPTFNEYGS